MITLENNKHKIIAMNINGYNVLSIYIHGQKVWPEEIINSDILSCFYNGYWIDAYPWTDNTPWINNNK